LVIVLFFFAVRQKADRAQGEDGAVFFGACGRIRKNKRGVERMNLISC